ncbi:hypothetical protein BN903_37 [Halorubrum sp. AJ67]|nr:hypothetical protein BN903_37 [Halorubrum sp. AJ67]
MRRADDEVGLGFERLDGGLGSLRVAEHLPVLGVVRDVVKAGGAHPEDADGVAPDLDGRPALRAGDRLPFRREEVGDHPRELGGLEALARGVDAEVELVVPGTDGVRSHLVERLDHVLALELEAEDRRREVVAVPEEGRVRVLAAKLLDDGVVPRDVYRLVASVLEPAVEVRVVDERERAVVLRRHAARRAGSEGTDGYSARGRRQQATTRLIDDRLRTPVFRHTSVRRRDAIKHLHAG